MAGYGDIPQLPNPFETASSAILAAIKKMPQLTDLTAKLGKASAAGAAAQMEANLPGYTNMLSKDVSNITAAIEGEMGEDEKAKFWQSGAERGVGLGLSPESPNIDTAYLRVLGLMRADRQALGHKQMGEIIGWTPTGPAVDPTKLIPDWADLQQMLAMQAIYNAAPKPTAGAYEGTTWREATHPGLRIAPSGPSLPSPTFAGATRPTTWRDLTLGNTVYGATGAGGATMYPGYHWDPAVGDYVKDEPQFTYGGAPAGGGYTNLGQPSAYPGAGTVNYGVAEDLQDILNKAQTENLFNWDMGGEPFADMLG